MKKVRYIAVVAVLLAAVVACPWPAGGQQMKRASPHETINAKVGGSMITVTYGRPYSKDPKKGDVRKVWGGLVPWGKAWRAGADEATTLIAQNNVVFGDTTIPAGAYTIYMVPAESGPSKLAFSKKLGAWGIPVDEKNDVARVDMTKGKTDKSLDQFTITVGLKDKADKAGPGVIRFAWEDAEFSSEFTVKK